MNSLTTGKKDSKERISAIQTFFQSLDQRVLIALKILLASCFIACSAQIKIPLFFTPIPLVIANLSVLLVGAFLGSRNGVLADLCYLIQGCIGLPVFAGGSFGIAYFMGPTGGYLIGYILLAYLVGKFFERQKNLTFFRVASLLSIFSYLQLIIGSLWLGYYVGFENCFILGFYPFVVTETLKAICLTAFFKMQQPCHE